MLKCLAFELHLMTTPMGVVCGCGHPAQESNCTLVVGCEYHLYYFTGRLLFSVLLYTKVIVNPVHFLRTYM